MTEQMIDKVLRLDPLAEAERLTGKSYKESEETSHLGLALAFQHSRVKDQLLRDRGDTVLRNDLGRYQAIITGLLDFEQVLALPFTGNEAIEMFYVYARRDGLLLKFDTYGGNHVNGGNILYNWKSNDKELFYNRTLSSGHWLAWDTDKVWVGSHDCREAIVHKIHSLEAEGSFVSPWREAPFLWLLHYMDTKADNYDYRAITKARVEMLPEWVRMMIGEVA